MKKTFLLFLGLFTAGWGYSQSLSPEVIASAGEHFTNGAAQISWTLGEPVIETFDGSGTAVLTQGFHQTNLMIVAVHNPASAFRVQVFPNPTAGMVSIEAQETAVPLLLELSDATGRILLQQRELLQLHTLDLSTYPAGMYQLRLRAKDQNAMQTFKIIKLN